VGTADTKALVADLPNLMPRRSEFDSTHPTSTDKDPKRQILVCFGVNFFRQSTKSIENDMKFAFVNRFLVLASTPRLCTKRSYLPPSSFALMKTRSHAATKRTAEEMSSSSLSATTTTTTTSSPLEKMPSANSPNKPTKKQKEQSNTTTPQSSELALPWYTKFTKGDEEYNTYMSTEWGFEKRGDVALFEKLSLEGAQSGLSWLTILRKRDAYRKTFHGFDIDKVAAMTDQEVDQIVSQEHNNNNPRNIIVRHRGKIQSVIHNAKCIQEMQSKKNDYNNAFDAFLWSFVHDKPIVNRWKLGGEAQSTSEESVAMSKALKKLAFKFVGPTTSYAMMQSVGMVLDHPEDSPEWNAGLERLGKRPGGFQERTKV
jgi:DNA-3-methyladenine glycosylase I